MNRTIRTGLRVLAGAGVAAALATPAAAQKTVTVVGKEFKFEPSTVELEAGETLVIKFKNQGALSHNLTFKKLDADTGTIQTDGTETIRVQPEPGTYTFVCTVPGHEAAGMTGTLKVQ
ncbi:nitrite reductase (NO-forming) [Limimonas halophila]|uniref:Nitrite reductase (NO-forming) n=1 Tax=Limimonas halophila TaxID=1082479 RepID=A0A1G7RGA9_9PROT|nr:cupredoxin domain-containing protein [Limimonas halophila]SDG09866.1 nitrite reductase (NO-forming) [Limimonas halophila]